MCACIFKDVLKNKFLRVIASVFTNITDKMIWALEVLMPSHFINVKSKRYCYNL